jgi:hypothetical protein
MWAKRWWEAPSPEFDRSVILQVRGNVMEPAVTSNTLNVGWSSAPSQNSNNLMRD